MCTHQVIEPVVLLRYIQTNKASSIATPITYSWLNSACCHTLPLCERRLSFPTNIRNREQCSQNLSCNCQRWLWSWSWKELTTLTVWERMLEIVGLAWHWSSDGRSVRLIQEPIFQIESSNRDSNTYLPQASSESQRLAYTISYLFAYISCTVWPYSLRKHYSSTIMRLEKLKPR